MSNIKIFVTHTPNSSQMCVSDPLLYHVTAGSDFQTKPLPEDMLKDNTGDHISYKNKSYCELTTQYWAWKNIEADYYGFCHYRRYFSFAPEMLPEAGWGCLTYPYMDENTRKKLCIQEQSIRQKIEPYDFLIAKGIHTRELYADSVYEHYKNASELKIRDLDSFCEILCGKYPQMRAVSESYMNGKTFYPCNMFIMKKELFCEYSGMLFDLLEEFEKRTDLSLYSREGLRTPGHLGERFAGIYYEYIRQKGGYRLGELQMALIEHTKPSDVIVPVKQEKLQEIPVVLAADQAYVPVLFTCVSSIIDNSDAGRNYHIYIFHTDISEDDMQVFDRELSRLNIRIDFVDVGVRVSGYRLQAKEHITTETFYRFLILDILKDYPKVVYLDSDLIVHRDIAVLYDLQLEDSLLAAAIDPDFAGQYNGANLDTKQYCDEVLGLSNPFSYVQAGVLVFNVEALNQKISVQELFRMADEGDYKYSDQDVLNIVCQGRIKKIPMSWNMLVNNRGLRYSIIKSAPAGILEEYEQARKEPYIIHYAGDRKPWDDPKADFAQAFWKAARKTPYYEVLLWRAVQAPKEKNTWIDRIVEQISRIAKKILPQGSWIRRTAGRLYWKLK